MVLRDLILIFEILAFLVSLLLVFRKNVYRYLQFFPVFLFITVVVETIGFALREKVYASMPMYNYFTTFEFVFYFFVLYFLTKNSIVKKSILFLIMLYPIAAAIYILSTDPYTFHSLTYNIGAITLVCLCVFYFYKIFKTPTVNNLFKESSFWISIGLLTYYGCTGPLFSTIGYLTEKSEFEVRLFTLILTIANIMLYVSFIASFLCFLKFSKR